VRSSQKPVTATQIRTFNAACEISHKTTDEISAYLFHEHQVTGLKDLRRGKPFTEAIRWASAGPDALAPKPEAAPALQGSLPLPKPAPSFAMRVGGKVLEVEPKTGSYSV